MQEHFLIEFSLGAQYFSVYLKLKMLSAISPNVQAEIYFVTDMLDRNQHYWGCFLLTVYQFCTAVLPRPLNYFNFCSNGSFKRKDFLPPTWLMDIVYFTICVLNHIYACTYLLSTCLIFIHGHCLRAY